ncbi:hypothetical protein H6F74_09130 [Trichocoleus sp. FACHB-90]|uniref:hypothetical protein n=1 Tax=Cyanophyceae TaxID=3028117 RepID=UPI0016895F63|nr:hypothetical protein [Trichocoleus sp. FACHB-90]MBD1834916.1 hypothetical protein [Cyanobacteria bacterium FACHB-472]MBD1926410.1 hypothetical protein [Trichocoleus sp. FACHB-90]
MSRLNKTEKLPPINIVANVIGSSKSALMIANLKAFSLPIVGLKIGDVTKQNLAISKHQTLKAVKNRYFHRSLVVKQPLIKKPSTLEPS